MLKRKLIVLLLSILILIVGIVIDKSFYNKKLIQHKTIREVSYCREKIANKIINNNIIFLEKLKNIKNHF